MIVSYCASEILGACVGKPPLRHAKGCVESYHSIIRSFRYPHYYGKGRLIALKGRLIALNNSRRAHMRIRPATLSNSTQHPIRGIKLTFNHGTLG